MGERVTLRSNRYGTWEDRGNCHLNVKNRSKLHWPGEDAMCPFCTKESFKEQAPPIDGIFRITDSKTGREICQGYETEEGKMIRLPKGASVADFLKDLKDATWNAETHEIKTSTKKPFDIDIEKWFGLRAPTDDEALRLAHLRGVYTGLAHAILAECPASPDRTVAIRQLKESMQTAISAIVCADTWER